MVHMTLTSPGMVPMTLTSPRDGPDDLDIIGTISNKYPGDIPARDESTGIEFLGAFKVIPRPNFVQFLTDLKLLHLRLLALFTTQQHSPVASSMVSNCTFQYRW